MSGPTLSVIMPVFNAGHYLADAVASILRQTFQDFEFLIIDDGSSDHSLRLLHTFAGKDSRIRVISRPNTGIVGALNDALALAQGPLIARMDADDVAMPERLQLQVQHLQTHADCVALGTWVTFIDSRGAPIKPYQPPPDHEGIEEQLFLGNGGAIIHPSLMVRKWAIEQAGGYRPQCNLAEDLDLYFRLLPIGKLANLEIPLLRYRIHRLSTNHQKSAAQFKLLQSLVAEARLVRNLPPIALAPHHPLSKTQFHCQVAAWAIEGQQWSTALAHAFAACLASPANRQAQRLLSYAFQHRWPALFRWFR